MIALLIFITSFTDVNVLFSVIKVPAEDKCFHIRLKFFFPVTKMSYHFITRMFLFIIASGYSLVSFSFPGFSPPGSGFEDRTEKNCFFALKPAFDQRMNAVF